MEIPKYRTLWTWDYCTYWDNATFARGQFPPGFPVGLAVAGVGWKTSCGTCGI